MEWIARASCEVNPSGTKCVCRRVCAVQCEARLNRYVCLCLHIGRFVAAGSVFFFGFFFSFVLPLFHTSLLQLQMPRYSSISAREFKELLYICCVVCSGWCRYQFCLNYLHAMRCNRDISCRVWCALFSFGYTVNRKRRQHRVKRARRSKKK